MEEEQKLKKEEEKRKKDEESKKADEERRKKQEEYQRTITWLVLQKALSLCARLPIFILPNLEIEGQFQLGLVQIQWFSI